MIHLKNISKRFHKNEVLQSISLHIETGKIHGIIGASGAGKSTLLRMINGLEKPSSGEVYVNQKNLTRLKGKELRIMRRSIGMIFQGYYLVGNKTVYSNIALPLQISKYPKKDIDKRVMETLHFVGLERFKDYYPSQLSGGQRQRVAIARAIANHPKVLLCDEPTSSLDPNTTEEVLKVLQRINREMNVTIVFVSHEMDVIKSLCEHVTVLDNGKVYDDFPIQPSGLSNVSRAVDHFIAQLKSGGGDDAS